MPKDRKCRKVLGSLVSATFLTPSSISILRKSLVLVLPNRSDAPTVSKMITIVVTRLKVGLMSIPPDLKDMNPTASRTKGTEISAREYPANQAKMLVTANSSIIMPVSVPSVPPITRWMEISRLRCSSDSTRP